MTTLSTRQTAALVALFVLTSLAFIQLDNRRLLEPVKDIFSTVLSPVANGFSGLTAGANQSVVERELAAVKAERDTLAAEAARLRAENRELDQMRQQLRLQTDRPTWRLLQARVRNADPSGQQLMLSINKGSADQVRVGMAVVAQGQNYIGQVTEVWEHSAKVMLVIDASQRVGARLDSGA
ncbi:MAG: rod shape-determining protein MreC, partial [Chloroflexia bacterium]|nr:rod shape-determining protein MreC [Chloroflexia bacterium]